MAASATRRRHSALSFTSTSASSQIKSILASFEDLLLHVILDVSHDQRIRDFLVMRYINVRFTYLLTYLRSRLMTSTQFFLGRPGFLL